MMPTLRSAAAAVSTLKGATYSPPTSGIQLHHVKPSDSKMPPHGMIAQPIIAGMTTRIGARMNSGLSTLLGV